MVRKYFSALLVFIAMGSSHPAAAAEFSFTFDWGKMDVCDDGSTYDVPSPIFTLSNVPPGAKKIFLSMEDTSIGYDHEGGSVEYTGENVLKQGAFQYLVPCPPDGTHTYEWTVFVKNANGDTIGKAVAAKYYP